MSRFRREPQVVDATGMSVIPGIIETHSHTGFKVLNLPATGSNNNELSSPINAHVRAIDGLDSGDPALALAVASGITTQNITTGSRSPNSGQSALVKSGRNRRGHVLGSRRDQVRDPRHDAVSELPRERAGGLRPAERRTGGRPGVPRRHRRARGGSRASQAAPEPHPGGARPPADPRVGPRNPFEQRAADAPRDGNQAPVQPRRLHPSRRSDAGARGGTPRTRDAGELRPHLAG